MNNWQKTNASSLGCDNGQGLHSPSTSAEICHPVGRFGTEIISHRLQPVETVVSVEAIPPPRWLKTPRWKRVLDILLILLALPVLAPVMLCVALVVRCVSAGPVLFRQERVGLFGKRFFCFKFRTMMVGNHTAAHKGHLTELMDSNAPMVKMDDKGDPRIIPFGVLVRSSGLDELPQILNVILGQMSLVGPRPCVPYEYEKYLPWQKERFNVLPGLTGLWQVSGKNNTTFHEMMRLDIRYARTSSICFDLWIIFKTIPALIIQMIQTRRRRRQQLRKTQCDAVKPAVAPAKKLNTIIESGASE